MAKKNKNKKPKLKLKEKHIILGKTILDEAFNVPEEEGSTDNLQPVFSFRDLCNNHFQLHEWQEDEIKKLVQTFRDCGNWTWSEAKKVRGFNLKPVDPRTFSKSLPEFISPDLTILEFRVSKRARVFGYRARNVFHIIWFDRNHEVYPMS